MNQSYYEGKDAYEDLANAIIYSAIQDYQKAYKCLRRVERKRKKLYKDAEKYPEVFYSVNNFRNLVRRLEYNHSDMNSVAEIKNIRAKLSDLAVVEATAINTIRECERFFFGSWIRELSHISGVEIKKRVDNDLLKKGYELLKQVEREEQYRWD